MESLQGQLLISGGRLFDLNFRQTVLLIVQHDDDGAMGIVLNRPMEVTVAEAVPPLADLVKPGELLFQGGPVQPSQVILVAELTDASLADVLAFGSVGLITGDVSPDIQSDILRARVFAGYAGWSPGQLESEMEDSWIVDPATADDVFTAEPKLLWRHVVERKGPAYRNLARIPFDPTLN